MYHYLKHIFLFTAVALLIPACTPLLDDQFRDYSHDEHTQRIQLQKAHMDLNKIKDIDIALHLNKELFSSLVNKSFQRFNDTFITLHSGEFSNVSFGELQFYLSRQQAFSKLEFSFEVDALKRKVFGYIKAKHILSAGRDEFVIATNFDEIVIERVENDEVFKKNSEKSHLISSSVKSFMKALNTEILHSPLSIPVDMNVLKEINAKKMFFSSDYKLHSAKPIHMLTKMKLYMPYIYEDGVVFLGASQLTNDQEVDPSGVDTTALWILLRDKISHTLNQNMGITLDMIQKSSSCYISKAYLSKQMNLSLKNIDLRVIKKPLAKLTDETAPFFKEIVLEDKKSLPACDQGKEECSSRLQVCERDCTRNYGVHNCEDCSTLNPFERVRCLSRQEACKSKEELLRYECKRSEQRCQQKNDELGRQCEIDNRRIVSQCEEKKAQIELTGGSLSYAKLAYDFNVINAYSVQRIRNIVFDHTFDTLEVLKDIHVSMDSRIHLDLIHTRKNDFNCSLGIKEPLFTHSYADHTGERKRLSLCMKSLDNGYLSIKAKEKTHSMVMQLSHTPYENLLAEDAFFLHCSFQGIPMLPISKSSLLKRAEIPQAFQAMAGELELMFEAEEISFLIAPISLNKDTLLYPSMDVKSVSFRDESLF